MTSFTAQRRLLLLSYLVALLPAAVFFNVFQIAPRGEGAVYWKLGNQWATVGHYTSLNHPGQPEGIWPPGYAAFVCVVTKVLGGSSRMIVAANMVLYAIMIALAGRIAFLAYGEKLACAAMLLTGSLYEIFTLPSLILPENLFTPLMLGAVAILLDHHKPGQVLRWALAGLLLGLATLTLEAAILMPLFLAMAVALWGWWPWRQRVQVLVRLLVLTAAFCVPMGLWAKRNYEVYHAFVPVSLSAGEDFALANNKFNTYWYLDIHDPRRRSMGLYGTEIEKYRRAVGTAWDEITTNKIGFLVKSFTRGYWAFSGTNAWWMSRTVLQVPPYDLDDDTVYLETILLLQWVLFIVAAIQGVRYGRHTLHPRRLLLLAVCCYFVLYESTQPNHLRHRLPIVPLFAVFAAFYLLYVHQHRRVWRRQAMEGVPQPKAV